MAAFWRQKRWSLRFIEEKQRIVDYPHKPDGGRDDEMEAGNRKEGPFFVSASFRFLVECFVGRWVVLFSSVTALPVASPPPEAVAGRPQRRWRRRGRRKGGVRDSGLGRLVRLPRFCCKKKKKKKKEEEEVGPSVSEVVEGDGAGCRGSSRTLSVSSDGEKPEEISLNLGMGLGPVFLLTRCATEFKRMTEMQAQMESLLKEITNEVLRNDVIHSALESSNHATFSGPDCSGDVHSSKASPSQSHIASFQQEGARCAIEPDVQSNYATISENKSCLKMDQLEAEIEVEPEHLQPNLEREYSSVL